MDNKYSGEIAKAGAVIRGLSFIVICRNEEFSVSKCLRSIAAMNLKECEVVCVDSDSTDKTLEVMKGFADIIENLMIVSCKGYVNAAVARNAGTGYATGKYLYFVDGDIELSPNFIIEAIDKIETGQADAVTGGLDEIVYSEGYGGVESPGRPRRQYEKARTINDSGGTFLAGRRIVEKVGPWDERFIINEDFDYTLRISRYGRLMAIPEVMGIHHTQAHQDRDWRYFKLGYPVFFGMLIRRNISQPAKLLSVMRNYRVGFAWWGALLFSIIFSVIFSGPFPAIIIGFGLFIIIDSLWGLWRKKKLLPRLLAHYLEIPLVLFGIFRDRKTDGSPTEITRVI